MFFFKLAEIKLHNNLYNLDHQMKNLKPFTEKEKTFLIKKRKGESKFGEHIQLIPNLTNIYEDILALDVDYIIVGISESIGVYANCGVSGTHNAWKAVIKVLLNIQSNRFTKPDRVAILGHLDYSETQVAIESLDQTKKKSLSKARKFVSKIDTDVTHLISKIIEAGKTPIIIGGGHNNAYGNIKGCALAYDRKINVVNFDAHTDFRSEEGRHSGNGFSYAFAEGFLKNYFIFGLHENYTSDKIFSSLEKIKSIAYNTYEAMEIRNEKEFNAEINVALNHISDRPFGIEIDCDAIKNVPSSAKSPSGFSIKQARRFVNCFGSHSNASYLHICEAAPTEASEKQVGKMISYLITDFVRAHGTKNN